MNKWLNRAIIVFQYGYETRVAPFFATYLWFLWWPAYALLKKHHYCFVINIAEGTGQVLPELDNFLLALQLKEVDPLKKYIWLRTRNDFSQALVPLYKKYFAYAKMSNIVYDLCLPIMLRWRNITHDAGMAGLHWQLPESGVFSPSKPWHTYLYMMPKTEPFLRWREYYRRRLDSGEYAPLTQADIRADKQLIDFLAGDMDKIVLLHIKTNIMNATALPTDPETYVPAIRYLQEKGYRLIFVGRESMPEQFRELRVMNYAQSPLASFLHDLQLFTIAEFSITGGSGIAWIADCLRKPVLYLNSWHLYMPPAGRKCVFIPALVKNMETGNSLRFPEQYALYLDTPTEYGDKFPFKMYEPMNVKADDIVHAVKELEQVITTTVPFSELQARFQVLEPESWMKFAQSRISDAFIQKHRNLL